METVEQLRAEVEHALARERTAWDVHAEHVERMNALLLREKSLRDHAEAEADALRVEVKAAEDAREWWAEHAHNEWHAFHGKDNPDCPYAHDGYEECGGCPIEPGSFRDDACDSCNAQGVRLRFSPDHGANFCDGCFERENPPAGEVTPPAEQCKDCGHLHTPDGCTGPATESDVWAGVSPAVCDCDARPITTEVVKA